MLPLAAIGLATSAIKGVTGLAQYLKGRKMSKNLNRPEYEIPMEIRDKLSTAQMLAYQGLPEEQKQQFLQNMQRSTQGSLAGLSTRRAGLSGIGALAQTESDSLTNLMSLDAQTKMQNIQNLQNVRSEVAGYKDKSFEINKLNPYYEKSDAAAALKGAGLQNMMNSLDSVNDIAGQSQYANALGGEASPTGSQKINYNASSQLPETDLNGMPMKKRGVYGYYNQTYTG